MKLLNLISTTLAIRELYGTHAAIIYAQNKSGCSKRDAEGFLRFINKYGQV